MYKSKVFNTIYDMTEFLNNNRIDKEAIVSMFNYPYGVALIWITRE